MEFREYKGISLENQIYHIIVNRNFDISNAKDESGKPFTFIKNINCKGEIKNWNPFFAIYKNYDGSIVEVKFRCVKCGSKSCERYNHKKFSDPYFFQGSYKCSTCGKKGFNYYSDCFFKTKQEVQLTLF